MRLKRPNRTDLVINMTLAETFLLLLFVVWYAQTADTTTGSRELLAERIRALEDQNKKLSHQIGQMQDSLRILRVKIDMWRRMTGHDEPMAPEVFAGSKENLERQTGIIDSLKRKLGSGIGSCFDDGGYLADLYPNEDGTIRMVLLRTDPLNIERVRIGQPPLSVKDFKEIGEAYRRYGAQHKPECRFPVRLLDSENLSKERLKYFLALSNNYFHTAPPR
jgi:hypothetical protein